MVVSSPGAQALADCPAVTWLSTHRTARRPYSPATSASGGSMTTVGSWEPTPATCTRSTSQVDTSQACKPVDRLMPSLSYRTEPRSDLGRPRIERSESDAQPADIATRIASACTKPSDSGENASRLWPTNPGTRTSSPCVVRC